MILIELVFQSNQSACPFIGELRSLTFKIIIGRYLVILITSLLFFWLVGLLFISSIGNRDCLFIVLNMINSSLAPFLYLSHL